MKVAKNPKIRIFHVDLKITSLRWPFYVCRVFKLFGKTLTKLKKLDEIFGSTCMILIFVFFDTPKHLLS